MFGLGKKKSQINKDELERIKYAQKRINQKKRLYTHFILFLIGTAILIFLDLVIDIDQGKKFFGTNWFVLAACAWFLLVVYHFISVFVTHNFMGKEWEQKQLDKLVAKQYDRISEMKDKLKKEERKIAESEVFNEKQKSIRTKSISSTYTHLTIIAAVDENNGIGKNNSLIWDLKKDLKHFKNLTSGHHIIMGRKTFESFAKPLPNRVHIVITRQKKYKAPEGVIIVNSLADAIDAAQGDDQPFIIGGGEIYKQAMHFANKIELTKIHHIFEADTFFPVIDQSIFKEVANEFHKKDDEHAYDFSFIRYERI